jgi:hypothetical protein
MPHGRSPICAPGWLSTPAGGYKTWDERMAELDASKAQGGCSSVSLSPVREHMG